jgi:hypothetical protein
MAPKRLKLQTFGLLALARGVRQPDRVEGRKFDWPSAVEHT